MNADDLHDHDALARRAAVALRADVERRADVDAALTRVLDADDTHGLVVQLPVGGRTARRPGRGWLGAAAAVAVLATGAVVYATMRDSGSRVVPADPTATVDTDVVTTADTTDTTAPAPDPNTSATTDPGTTDPATTATESTSATPDTAVALPPASEVDALAGLEVPPPLDPVEVPAYLPTTPVAERSQVELTSNALPIDAVTQLVQTWATEDGRVIEVSTRLGGAGAPVFTAIDVVPTSVWPWDDAVVVTTMAEGYAQVHLSDPSGTVTLWGSGVTSDELVAVASRLALAPAGWQLSDDPASGFVQTHSGWRRAEFAARVVQWDAGTVRGELIVSLGVPDSIRTGFFGYGTPSTLDDVDGAPAMVSEPGSGTTVTWSPAPDVVVVLGYSGSVDETLALARSLQVVDEATWQAAGVVDTTPADGCDSSFFC